MRPLLPVLSSLLHMWMRVLSSIHQSYIGKKYDSVQIQSAPQSFRVSTFDIHFLCELCEALLRKLFQGKCPKHFMVFYRKLQEEFFLVRTGYIFDNRFRYHTYSFSVKSQCPRWVHDEGIKKEKRSFIGAPSHAYSLQDS